MFLELRAAGGRGGDGDNLLHDMVWVAKVTERGRGMCICLRPHVPGHPCLRRNVTWPPTVDTSTMNNKGPAFAEHL